MVDEAGGTEGDSGEVWVDGSEKHRCISMDLDVGTSPMNEK